MSASNQNPNTDDSIDVRRAGGGAKQEDLRIGDFARLGGTNLRTLRYYEQLGLITPTARSEGGFRFFRRADLGRLKMIRSLQSLGLELAQIRALLGVRDQDRSREEMLTGVRNTVEQHAALLDDKIKQLQAERLELGKALSQLDECETCEEIPNAENQFCKSCSKCGHPLPSNLGALF